MTLAAHLEVLADEAVATDERRLIVLEGDRQQSLDRLQVALKAADIDTEGWVALGEFADSWEALAHDRADRLLGRTVDGLLIDATAALRPNVIGRSVGAVAGGGLIVLLIGAIDDWPTATLASDRRLAVWPYDADDVHARFRRRFVETLVQHPGVSIVEAATGEVVVDGATGPKAPPATCTATPGDRPPLDDSLAAACATADQRDAVAALVTLEGEDVAIAEAHRGRGKSAAAGIAAAGRIDAGETVIVTGPGRDAVDEVLTRAADVVGTTVVEEPHPTVATGSGPGRLTYRRPADLDEAVEVADILIVDEAATLPVDRLRATLEAERPVAYLTTVHGYEGTGRGFTVRFRGHLEAADRPTTELRLREPIRYRAGDPIESWQFRALLLDAAPPPGTVVEAATPSTVAYEHIDRERLAEDEATLRELFGLLVVAHYRTEPGDLQRLLDAPNVQVHALSHEGHPVAVAMLAEEGGLDADWCDRLYAGEAIRGHMLPDLLTTQLRDRSAGRPTGLRVLRIATHDAVRRRGLATALLGLIREAVGDDVDYLGAGFGATPELLAFWRAAGYRPIHLGTSRNPRSGEHSAVVARGLTETGQTLVNRHERRLVDRLPGQLPDALDGVDPAIIEAVLRTLTEPFEPAFPAWMEDAIEATARGPGQVATAPSAFRQVAIGALADGVGDDLTPIQRHLLVRRVLQARPLWVAAKEVDRTLGDARAALRAAIELTWVWYTDDRTP